MNRGLISRGCSHGLIQYFPLIVRVHTRANVNKMLTEKKIVVTRGNFRYVKSQSAAPLEHGKSAIWGVAHPLRRLSVRSISYYTCVKLSMQYQMRFPLGRGNASNYTGRPMVEECAINVGFHSNFGTLSQSGNSKTPLRLAIINGMPFNPTYNP